MTLHVICAGRAGLVDDVLDLCRRPFDLAMMEIDCDFDAGSIVVLDASDPLCVRLALRGDNASTFVQWFFFRVRAAAGTACGFCIENAASASYPGGWPDYQVCASYDGERWFRVGTGYQDGALDFGLTLEHDLITFACFPPYETERYEALLRRADDSPRARVMEIGKSVQGRLMQVISFGEASRSVPRIWVIAHQHPGETMAGFCAEGLVDRLLDEGDAVASALLECAQIYVVPRMNPDGCAIGNHRTNAAGRDLNREWVSPSEEVSPEVLCVRRAIEETGVDMFLDIHGDESIPYVFAFGAEGVPAYTARLAAQEELFYSTLREVDPDFQTEQGYDRDPPGEADLRLANMFMAQERGCLSVGLEMPFKDNANRPEPGTGWSTDRSRGFGRNLVEVMLRVVREGGF